MTGSKVLTGTEMTILIEEGAPRKEEMIEMDITIGVGVTVMRRSVIPGGNTLVKGKTGMDTLREGINMTITPTVTMSKV